MPLSKISNVHDKNQTCCIHQIINHNPKNRGIPNNPTRRPPAPSPPESARATTHNRPVSQNGGQNRMIKKSQKKSLTKIEKKKNHKIALTFTYCSPILIRRFFFARRWFRHLIISPVHPVNIAEHQMFTDSYSLIWWIGVVTSSWCPIIRK